MTARVLVVDDIPANVKLLEAKLTAEYYEVLTANEGLSALEKAKAEQPDIILLDVMMPGMDGFEVCRKLKEGAETAHIPIVMVTALDQSADRVKGLEAGADDFLTKPVNDIALFARVRSLVRLKLMTDELRMRQATGEQMGILDGGDQPGAQAAASGRILVVEDRDQTSARIVEVLDKTNHVRVEPGVEEALVLSRSDDFDLIIVSLSLDHHDGLRLCSQLRSTAETRNTPVLVLVEDGDMRQLARALEIGVNDYLMRPLDRNELVARVATQLKRKRYSDRLRENLELSLEMAITDQLTGLYNRRYMAGHLSTLVQHSVQKGKSVSFLIIDIDFFKAINDTHGHEAGDEVLKEFANRIATNVRGIDLVCRYGGEEFVVVMPDTDIAFAYSVAERLRQQVAEAPFKVKQDTVDQCITISIGVTVSEGPDDRVADLLRRADQALYRAKREGRNRVVADAA
jgi:two-component system cell cycle response regulator